MLSIHSPLWVSISRCAIGCGNIRLLSSMDRRRSRVGIKPGWKRLCKPAYPVNEFVGNFYCVAAGFLERSNNLAKGYMLEQAKIRIRDIFTTLGEVIYGMTIYDWVLELEKLVMKKTGFLHWSYLEIYWVSRCCRPITHSV